MRRQIILVYWESIAGGQSVRWGSVHAAEMLREEVLPVEVVEIQSGRVVGVCRWWTEIATPEMKFDVLSAYVAFPFVLGREPRRATIGRQRAWEGSSA